MQNSECIEMFEKYLVEDKKASANTLSSYLRDIRQLAEYLDSSTEHGIVDRFDQVPVCTFVHQAADHGESRTGTGPG